MCLLPAVDMARLVLSLIVFVVPCVGYAKGFCFVKAETYYEQTFCEVSAKGHGKHLPDFNDFKKNEPLIQALLLKKPAARSGITLAMPSRKATSRRKKASSPKEMSQKETLTAVKELSSWRSTCHVKGELIHCPNAKFKLTGNKSNSKLEEGALSEANSMGLLPYQMPMEDSRAVNHYILTSYQRYLQKMLDIGLGGVTMSSGKFAYLFHDLTDRGLSFSGRFETMYRHLRKDKSTIRVDERVAVNHSLNIESCLNLNGEIISCSSSQKNYLFVKEI